MNALEFRDIRRVYRAGEEVLSGVSFSLEQGQVLGLLGRNGAGKTTLIHIAMGLIRAQQGTVRVLGLDPQADPVVIKRRVGFVSEHQILPPAMRVRGVLDMHRSLFPSWDPDLERRLLGRFSFVASKRVVHLSKGQARQLALLCAVAHRPELLLLDEPAGGLDPSVRREFLETAIQLLAESGTSILFSSHHMADVERMAERVVILHDKNVFLDSGLDDLRENSVLAVLPAAGPVGAAALSDTEGCLRVRQHGDTLRGVFRGSPETVRARLAAELGIEDAACRRVPLEDLFVELVGDDS